MITCERQLDVGIDGRNNRSGRILTLPLGRHLNLVGRGGLEAESKARAQNAEACGDVVQVGFSRVRHHF
jgi:hypothetical protein